MRTPKRLRPAVRYRAARTQLGARAKKCKHVPDDRSPIQALFPKRQRNCRQKVHRGKMQGAVTRACALLHTPVRCHVAAHKPVAGFWCGGVSDGLQGGAPLGWPTASRLVVSLLFVCMSNRMAAVAQAAFWGFYSGCCSCLRLQRRNASSQQLECEHECLRGEQRRHGHTSQRLEAALARNAILERRKPLRM